MVRCLTKKLACNKGFNMVEMMIAVGLTVLLMAGVYGFYTTSAQFYNAGVSAQTLQDGTNVVLRKIMAGETESGTIYRLSTAVSYMVPNGTANYMYTCGGNAQATPCNSSNTAGELYYCQDTPCTSVDSTARWYYLNSTGSAVIYHHPKNGSTVEEVIYQAPAGSTLNLRFSPGSVSTPADVIEIDVDLGRNYASGTTNSRMTSVSGDASTYVLLRNHP